MTSIRVTGFLDDFFETGCEGTYWSLDLDDPDNIANSPYQRLFILEKDDHLEVYDIRGQHILTVDIDPDYETGYASYPRNPSDGQPIALGRWIHWTQKGWNPDEWARLFIPKISTKAYQKCLLETFRSHNALDLIERYQKATSIPLPDPDFDRYNQLLWATLASFKNRAIVTRKIPGNGGAYLTSDESKIYLDLVQTTFAEANRSELLAGPLLSNEEYFERDRLLQSAVARFRASTRK